MEIREMNPYQKIVFGEEFAKLVAAEFDWSGSFIIMKIEFHVRRMTYEISVKGESFSFYLTSDLFDKLLAKAKDTAHVMLTPGYSYVSRETIEKVGLKNLKAINGGGEIIETKQETWRDRPPLL